MPITFETRTNVHKARFTIPKAVRKKLGLGNAGGERVALIIESPTGHYEGVKTLKSGPEVYGKDLNDSGIRKDQPITVQIARATTGRSEGRLFNPKGPN
jgi:bifunctional DNA-binding transcriptional regulator/antitoxin component of YhaV-PrlF toxin-antitoxin module